MIDLFELMLKDHIEKKDIEKFFSSFLDIDRKNILAGKYYWSLNKNLQDISLALDVVHMDLGFRTSVDCYIGKQINHYKYLIMAGQMAKELKTDVVIGDDFYEDRTAQDRIILITPENDVIRGFYDPHDGINDVVLDTNMNM